MHRELLRLVHYTNDRIFDVILNHGLEFWHYWLITTFTTKNKADLLEKSYEPIRTRVIDRLTLLKREIKRYIEKFVFICKIVKFEVSP